MKLFMPDQISLLIVQCVMPAQWLQQVVQAGTGTSPLVETNSAALCATQPPSQLSRLQSNQTT